MNRPSKIQYVINQNDNLYQLSRYYQTTVPEILTLNPNIDPYDLQAGSSITICPGDQFVSTSCDSNPPACPNPIIQRNLYSSMLQAWLQHAYWTRLLLVSTTNTLDDEGDTMSRALRNPADITKVFTTYYSPATVNIIEQLLAEHMRIESELITAMRDDQSAESEALSKRWHQNADQMAETFSNINPFYNTEDVRDMIYEHLRLSIHEIEMHLSNDYEASIEAFTEVEQSIIKISHYFSSGIISQFPQKFM
ncbi:LysM peptidoglycan-binding domain-containing protein [Kineothrix sp. MB12-C1]|uniref:LysM peptidoglycan-binding domain-containing protein n=1 Tax=Kineothrix sp. MB12-C1 TaxID=3070215 RepID=UPI0027D313CF|nr:LysM domain-containing protein [Kineothrix sp. MB12-C1]WMC91063.1 LysM domain-containing protein [Kineothrix sp. MB12-C1]